MKKIITTLLIVIAIVLAINVPVEAAQVEGSPLIDCTMVKSGSRYKTTFKVKGTSKKVAIYTKWRPSGVDHVVATKNDNIRACRKGRFYVASSHFKVTNKEKMSGKNYFTGKTMSVKGKLSGVKKGDVIIVYQIYLPGKTKPTKTIYLKDYKPVR